MAKVRSGRGGVALAIGVGLMMTLMRGPHAVGDSHPRPILHLYGGSPKGEICVLDLDGQNRRCLTDNRRFDYDAVWSPDGSQIAFVQQTNEPRNPDVYVMDEFGGSKTRLTRSPFDDDEPQ